MPCIVWYPLIVRQNFVVCRHVCLISYGVSRVKEGYGTLPYTYEFYPTEISVRFAVGVV
jgi:hypothetical protein